jgi:hypothetical protein
LSFFASVRRTGALRLRLPRDTPPGRYEGVVRFEDGEQPIAVEVEPQVRLHVFPGRIEVSAGAGERVSSEVYVINEGNAPAELRKAYAFRLFHEDSFVRILDRILDPEAQAQLREGRLGPLVDALNDQLGGRVRATVDQGAGAIAPGERRQLHVTFALPKRLLPGQIYSGIWHLHNAHCQLRVTVGGEAQQQETEP